MQVKVFRFDKSGKVSFTQEELEKLLNEVYSGGYQDGKRASNYWTWTSPYYTGTVINYADTTTNPTNHTNIRWTTTTNSTDNCTTATMYTDDTSNLKINNHI